MAKSRRIPAAGDSTSGAGVGERAPASKRSGGAGGTKPFDPASAPEGPSLAREEERHFHATHFTADPRGSAASGAPPGKPRRKVRGGSPPKSPGRPDPSARPRRRGGAGPA